MPPWPPSSDFIGVFEAFSDRVIEYGSIRFRSFWPASDSPNIAIKIQTKATSKAGHQTTKKKVAK